MAKNREALEDMLSIFRKFIGERKLELNVKKTKIVIFNKKEKGKKELWKWGKKNRRGEEL